MEATLLILDLLNLPSQAPQHAKLITVKEDEAFASTSQSSHAQLTGTSNSNLRFIISKSA